MASLKDLIVSGKTKLSNTLTTQDILPNENNTKDIGTSSQTYRNIYATKLYGKAQYAENDVNGNAINNYYLPRSGGTMTGTINSQNIIPTSSLSYTLGSTGSEYAKIFTRNMLTAYVDSSILQNTFALYLGYGSSNPTKTTYFYSSDGTTGSTTSRTLQATINDNGLKIDSHLGVAGTNTSYNLYNAGTTYLTNQVMMPGGFKTGSRVSSTGSGVEVTADGGIEIYHSSTPFIDFHYKADTGDYTSRIIESAKGYLNVSTGNLGVGGYNTSYNFYVNGVGYFTNNVGIGGYDSTYKLYVNGKSYFANSMGICGYDSTYKLYVSGPVKIGSLIGENIAPVDDNTYDLGSFDSEYARTYSRTLNVRHIDSSIPYAVSNSNYDLYLGYGSGNPTENIYFYSSSGDAGEEATSNALQATINSAGVKIDNHLGIAGTNSGYTLYNAGTTYLSNSLYFNENINQIYFRYNNASYRTFLSHQTAGNEALVLGMAYSDTSFIVANGESPTNTSNSRWQSITTPGLQVKNNCVSIGHLIANGVAPTHKLYVNGISFFTNNVGIGAYSPSCKLYVDGRTVINDQLMVSKACTLASGESSIYISSGSSSSEAGAGIEFYDATYRRFRITDYRGVFYIQSDCYYNNTGVTTGIYKTPSEQYRLKIYPEDGWINLGLTNPNYNHCINFDAFGNESALGTGTTTYTTFNGQQQGAFVFIPVRIKNTYATAGDVTSTVTKSITGSYFQFAQQSYNSSTYALNSYYEYYNLPTVTANKTVSSTYYIFTSKGKVYSSNSTTKRYVPTMTSSTSDASLYYETTIYTLGSVLYGAAWNDYAEYRTQKEEIQPGYCVMCDDDGELYKTLERLSPFEGITSDTYGFAIGETEESKTPLAVAGRVLVYTYEPREEFHAGDCVCAGPDGRVSKMSREEIREWPDRIVGIVSEIPEYKIWGTGNVEVNGRIWIKVR